MTVEVAKQLVDAAKKVVCTPLAGAWSGAFAVADDAGAVVYLEAINCALCDGPYLAMRKAEAFALWRRRTICDRVDTKGSTSYGNGAFAGTPASAGGIPLFSNGRVVGAVGVAAVGSRNAVRMIDHALLAEAKRLFGRQ